MRLDRHQRTAAAGAGAPVRVIAGAGTGKTAVVAERFRRLVSAGAQPSSVLVMTFTDRAAQEMRRRIEELAGVDAPSVGTIHSIALGWLRADGWRVGVQPGFRIVTGPERWILARELMWELGDAALVGDERPDDLVAPALQMLERLKQELVPLRLLSRWVDAAEDLERGALMRACVRLFRAYERECRARSLLDFDDLVERAVAMLASDRRVLEGYRRRYPHVLVDEYQDLNLAQERLVELITMRGAPFVVGDDDQSIYRFRGASRASLARFMGSFPQALTVALGANHRSSRQIVLAAATLIANNSDRLGKPLTATRAGARVELWRCADGSSEAAAIAAEAARLMRSNVSPSRIAVLCRTNAIARPIAIALAGQGLPHVVVGGHGLFDEPEIRDVIALLRILRDPTDVIAIARALVRPPWSLDPRNALGELMSRRSEPPLVGLQRWDQAHGFAVLMRDLVRQAATTDVRDLFFDLINRTRYLDALTAQLPPSEAAAAAANVSRFAEKVAEFCDSNPDHSLATYMKHLDLVLMSGEDEAPARLEGKTDAISVMTIHQAKGLEFDAVFVPSLVDGRLPQSGRSQRFDLPPSVLEPLVRGREDVVAEERRLLYVAMTRARRRLYLTRAERYEGGRRWRDSRFVAEVRVSGVVVEREFPRPTSPTPISSRVEASSDAGLVLSFSSIQVYRDCPRQYWYRYVQRLPAAQSAEAVHGVVLHEVLRRAGEARQTGQSVSSSRLRAMHAEVWNETAFPDANRAPIFKRNGLAQLEAYRAGGGLATQPAFVEREFAAAVDGFTLHGVIDRVDRTANGWRIIDYKSGRPVQRSRRDLQVALYALGAGASLNLHPLQLQVVYLADGKIVNLDEVEAMQTDARRIASDVAASISAGQFQSQPERRRCRLCPYRLACADAL